MPLPAPTARRARTLRRTVVTAAGPGGVSDHRRAARDVAAAWSDADAPAQVVEATAGHRLGPDLAGADLVLASVPVSLAAPLAALSSWLRIPYAGCPARAATLAADPGLTAAVLGDAGLAVAPGVAVDAGAARRVDYLDPVRVRPVGVASPVGHIVATSPPGLQAALDIALSFSGQAWVEELVEGEAVHLAVLRASSGGLVIGVPHASGAGSPFADERPVLDPATARLCPAGLDGPGLQRARAAAGAAYRVLGLAGAALVEVVDDGRRSAVASIDAAPPLTRDGLVAHQFAAAGLGYAELVRELAAGALGPGTAY